MKVAIDFKMFFEKLHNVLNEKTLRLVTAAAAESCGYGGVTHVAQAAGVARNVIYAGVKELENPEGLSSVRQRKPGGGAKKLGEKDPALVSALDSLIEPFTRGNPESALRWTSKSVRRLAEELTAQNHKVSHMTVARLLMEEGYTLQSLKKAHEHGDSPDRDRQFRHIHLCTEAFLDNALPVISVDAKKKELVGNFKNGGREYHPKGEAPEVEVYDFVNENGRVTPYGIYDVAANDGFVNVGISHDTARFAVDSIRRWWERMGSERYEGAGALCITSDCGGSNGCRNRQWKAELQRFANDYGMDVWVCHFPPGTSKWNKIEHRMFSFISMNWRGRPLESYEIIVNLIANTRTKKGLEIKAELSKEIYQTGVTISDEIMASLNILRHPFHPEWNYVIRPQKK